MLGRGPGSMGEWDSGRTVGIAVGVRVGVEVREVVSEWGVGME